MVYAVSVMLMLLSIALWLWYIGGFNRYIWFRPMTVFFAFYVLQVMLPCLYVYETSGWSQMSSMTPYPIMVTGAPLIILMGAALVSRFPKHVWAEWWHRPAHEPPGDVNWAWIMLVFGSVMLTVHIALVGGNIPLLQMFSGLSGRGLSESREDALKLLPFGVSYLIRWNIQLFLPFAALAFLALWIQRRSSFAVFVGASIIALFQAMFSVARSPVALMMIKFIALYFVMTRRKIRLVWIATAIVVLFSFATTVNIMKFDQTVSVESVKYQLFGPPDSAMTLDPNSLVGRAFYSTSWTVGAHVNHAPDYTNGFLLGRSVGWYARLTGQPNYPLSLEVMNQYKDSNRTGIANACFLGDAWANFGWVGVVSYSFLVGVWLAFLERCLLRLPRTGTNMALWALTSIEALVLAHTSFQIYLLTFGALPLGLFLWYRSQSSPDVRYPALA